MENSRSASRTACLIRELEPDERPRERLLRHGAGSLSDSELLAILLRTGSRGCSAVEMARSLIRESDRGLVGIAMWGPQQLRRPGLGPAKSATVVAAFEIAARLARSSVPERLPLQRPEAAARYLDLRFGRPEQEVMGALYLDGRHRLLAEHEVFRGTINRAAVEPRALLKHGLLAGAAGFLLFHTHPSGDPSPSVEDLTFTRRVAEAGEIVGVRLLDHLVIGAGGRWISLRERGGW